MKKEALTISRYWSSPQILTTITEESISLNMSLDDFMAALIEEIGSVTMIFTKDTFLTRMMAAKQRVIEKVKEESIKVI